MMEGDEENGLGTTLGNHQNTFRTGNSILNGDNKGHLRGTTEDACTRLLNGLSPRPRVIPGCGSLTLQAQVLNNNQNSTISMDEEIKEEIKVELESNESELGLNIYS